MSCPESGFCYGGAGGTQHKVQDCGADALYDRIGGVGYSTTTFRLEPSLMRRMFIPGMGWLRRRPSREYRAVS